ncbi:ABC transporter ATP-binding protein [Streptomyces lasiicapitis]|uniref:ABC transporter ATP-binding protein n=1 Tax=Streptomyces lasiicapitis TaxID=1923961 RepID=UPI00365554C1
MFRRRGRAQVPVVARAESRALALDGVGRTYRGGDVVALHPTDLVVGRGRFVAVMGPSGSGKSTLLQCAAGLDRPTCGTVRVEGVEIGELSEAALTRLRRERIGFVFQAHNLVPSLSVAENVALPLMLGGADATDEATAARAAVALAAVGLGDRTTDIPAELSGGQQQRVAIARALVTDPAVVFADEPTGALDPSTAHDVLALLRQAVDHDGHTVVMVTHDPTAAAWCDEAVFLTQGRVVAAMDRPDAGRVHAAMRRLGRRGVAA